MRFDFRRVRAAAASVLLGGASLLATVPVLGIGTVTVALLIPGKAKAACLGTHRTIRVDPSRGHFYNGLEKSLGLRAGEVILTFDDGPKPGTTTRILNALSDECAKATFFMSGRMANAYPSLAARVRREGHTVAGHTHGHENLAKLASPAVISTIDRGNRAIRAATGESDLTFFRYPYLAKSPRTDAIIKRKGLIAFGTNIDSKDYKKVSPATVVAKTMRDLKRHGKGIVLMHDIHARTASALPMLLDRLKAEGFKIVHMVPGRGRASEPALVASASPVPDDLSRTERRALALAQPVGKPRARILGGRADREATRDRRTPVVATAFARAEERKRSRAARLDVLKRGSKRASDKPMTKAQIARARAMVRESYRPRANLPLHARGRTVMRLERR